MGVVLAEAVPVELLLILNANIRVKYGINIAVRLVGVAQEGSDTVLLARVGDWHVLDDGLGIHPAHCDQGQDWPVLKQW